MENSKYSRGKHPNSINNLKPGCGGRRKAFGSEEKKKRYLTVTETGWEGIQPIIRELGCTSVSDFLEKVGRGLVEVKASA